MWGLSFVMALVALVSSIMHAMTLREHEAYIEEVRHAWKGLAAQQDSVDCILKDMGRKRMKELGLRATTVSPGHEPTHVVCRDMSVREVLLTEKCDIIDIALRRTMSPDFVVFYCEKIPAF